MTCRLSKCVEAAENTQLGVEDEEAGRAATYIATYIWARLYFKKEKSLFKMLQEHGQNEKFMNLARMVTEYHAGTINGIDDDICHRLIAKMG